MSTCTQERFLKDIPNHKINIFRDHGVDRHIRLSEPGNSAYQFDLITWPGHLCFTGDCGTYVFCSLHDMFEFFRTAGDINPWYWGEKLVSVDVNGKYTEFDKEEFKKQVTGLFESWKEDEDPDEKLAEEVWSDLSEQVISAAEEDEHCVYEAINSFESGGFAFEDFLVDGLPERHTFRFIWCLRAIKWAISKYDEEMLNEQIRDGRCRAATLRLY